MPAKELRETENHALHVVQTAVLSSVALSLAPTCVSEG